MDDNQPSTKESKQIKKDNLIYSLNETEKTACLIGIESEISDDNLQIPSSIIYESQIYIITVIGNSSFKKSKIQTINFSPDSQLQIIDSLAFSLSQIESISIPPSVTKICQQAFSNCSKLRRVEIPRNSQLQIIEREAFSFSPIERLFIPPQIKEICEKTFGFCHELVTIEIPPNSELQTIQKEAFLSSTIRDIFIPSSLTRLESRWCYDAPQLVNVTVDKDNKNYRMVDDIFIEGKSDTKSDIFDVLVYVKKDLKKFEIPSSIKVIGPDSFSDCQFTELFIPLQIETICEGAFNGSKLRRIEIPQDSIVTKIGESAFANSMIERIFIPKHVTVISEFTFSECMNLVSVEFHPDSELVIIETNAFNDSNIRMISLPSNLKIIKKESFRDCFQLESIEIPPNSKLQTIESHAFYNSSIERLFIPSSVKKLGKKWCSFTPYLVEVIIDKKNKFYSNFPVLNSGCVLGKSDPNNLIYDVFMFAARNTININFHPLIKKISSFAFTDSLLKSIFISPQIEKIQNSAFSDCHQLHKVEIPPDSELRIIEKDAFAGSAIDSIYIPQKVEKIGNDVFMECENLQIIEIGENSVLQNLSKAILPKRGMVMIPHKSSLAKNLMTLHLNVI